MSFRRMVAWDSVALPKRSEGMWGRTNRRQDRLRMGWRSVVLAFGIVLLAAPLRAEFLPPPDKIALPQERALFNSTLSRVLDKPNVDAAALPVLDEALAKLGEPTKLRGFVQFLRAGALAHQNKPAALEAIDESVRLLPGYSGPLLGASNIYAYSDRPAQAADYLMRASQIDPDIVRQIDEYEINNIFHRLSFRQDDRRARLLSERLLELGWLGESLGSRSNLARRAIEARMSEGDTNGARRLIPKLLLPAHSMSLLMDNEYRDLWSDIERWAGAELEKQWPIFLSEAREKWAASRDPAAAKSYAQALAAAGHYDTLIKEMLPLFSKPLNAEEDYDLIFAAATLADALARKGRWVELETMFDRASKVWPLGGDANALNLAANRARYMFYRGKTAEALAVMDTAIADAARWQGQVNGDALAAMHRYRACMLHKLGKGDEAAVSRAIAADLLGPSSRAELFLCLDQIEAARSVLIKALADEKSRDSVIAFVQKSDVPPMQSDYGRAIEERHAALRSDPKLLAEVAKYGRVLPFTLSQGAPPELAAGDEL